jgi:hypothetical protein
VLKVTRVGFTSGRSSPSDKIKLTDKGTESLVLASKVLEGPALALPESPARLRGNNELTEEMTQLEDGARELYRFETSCQHLSQSHPVAEYLLSRGECCSSSRHSIN